MKRNYYKILNVPYDADSTMIKMAFRRLAKRCHPDTSNKKPDDFVRIKEAFDVLSDWRKRRKYNKDIGVNVPFSSAFKSKRFSVHPLPKDVFDDLIDVVADRFNITRRKDFAIDLYLSNDEFKKGVKTSILIPQEKICPRCFGFGGTIFSECRDCNSDGTIPEDVKFELILRPPLSPEQEYEVVDRNNFLRIKLKKVNNG